MDLLLWRCAEISKSDEAEADEGDNLKTPLSDRGRRQSERLARWLKEHQPKEMKVVCSPATAAIQMAKMIGKGALVERRLGPDARSADLMPVVVLSPEHPALLVIAHQPALGGLASLLLGSEEAPSSIKKGALWWFSGRIRAGELQTVLRAVLTADLVK